uniref:G protein-coupled receptor n=1 Tax=Angiostrongylus cantonensis TaxID=6313 RepID=A0A0K0DD48_ANGCA
MANETCSSTIVVVSSVFPILLHVISITLTSRALQIQYGLRKMFHPFFSLLLSLLLLGYIVCSASSFIGSVLQMLAASEKIIVITTSAYYSFYFYITGMICCCVIERLVATIMMSTYEHNRQWFPVLLSQPFAIALGIASIFMGDEMVRAFSTLAFYLLNILISAVLEFLIPISLLFSHPVYRRQSVLRYERELMRISRSSVKDKTLPKVVVPEGKTKKLVRKNGMTHSFTAFKLDKTLNANLAYAMVFGD